jgi:hypothetical protein
MQYVAVQEGLILRGSQDSILIPRVTRCRCQSSSWQRIPYCQTILRFCQNYQHQVAFNQAPFGGAEHVLHYLAPYTHRVGRVVQTYRLPGSKTSIATQCSSTLATSLWISLKAPTPTTMRFEKRIALNGSSFRLGYVKQSLVVLDRPAPLDLHPFGIWVKRIKKIVHGFRRRNRRNCQ